MDISEDRKAHAVVLALSGKLDATTAKTFEEKLLSQIEKGVAK
jgi:anti-anti-sigma regulatory factor